MALRRPTQELFRLPTRLGHVSCLQIDNSADWSLRVPMSLAPQVSVIMPAFNAGRYIADSIRSLLAQTFADWELVIVNDGSTDDTQTVVECFAAAEARIRVHSQRNRGVSAARNLALAQSHGRFVALLDSDDVWDPAFLQKQLAVFDADPSVSVVTGNAYNWGGPFDGGPLRPITEGRRRLSLRDLLQNETSVCIMSVFRREVYDTIGGYDERLRCNEDYQFWIRVALAGFMIVQTPEPVGRYRRRPDSLSADEPVMLDGIVRVLEEARTRCADMPEESQVIDRQIQRFKCDRFVLSGKRALLDGRFAEARSAFASASRLSGGGKLRAIAGLCRIAPRSLRALYRFRAGHTGRLVVPDSSAS
jgi:hypothetical protein